jgi:hypothetical protein
MGNTAKEMRIIGNDLRVKSQIIKKMLDSIQGDLDTIETMKSPSPSGKVHIFVDKKKEKEFEANLKRKLALLEAKVKEFAREGSSLV